MYLLHSKPGWPSAVVWVPAIAVAAALLLPPVYLIVRTLGDAGDAWEALFRLRVLEILGRTILLVVAVTAGSIAVAVPLAWLTVRTDLPFRRVLTVVTAPSGGTTRTFAR